MSAFAWTSSLTTTGSVVRMCQMLAPGEPAPGNEMLIGTLKIAIPKRYCDAVAIATNCARPAASRREQPATLPADPRPDEREPPSSSHSPQKPPHFVSPPP